MTVVVLPPVPDPDPPPVPDEVPPPPPKQPAPLTTTANASPTPAKPRNINEPPGLRERGKVARVIGRTIPVSFTAEKPPGTRRERGLTGGKSPKILHRFSSLAVRVCPPRLLPSPDANDITRPNHEQADSLPLHADERRCARRGCL